MQQKVLDIKALQQTLEDRRRNQQRIVTTNGCFDVLHVGHLRYLQAAREQGDLLVVLLNSDISVKAIKGPRRPIVPQDERAEMLAGLACVDYVCLFDESSPENVLKQIKPHVHVKGGDYNAQTLPEAETLNSIGTRMVFIPLVEGRSTTNIIQRIVETCQPV